MSKILIRSGFPGIIPVLWSFKSFQVSCKIQSGTLDVPGFSKSKKYDISDKEPKYFDIPAMGDNICRIRTAFRRPLAGRTGEGEEDV
jgi:hypothetical protein